MVNPSLVKAAKEGRLKGPLLLLAIKAGSVPADWADEAAQVEKRVAELVRAGAVAFGQGWILLNGCGGNERTRIAQVFDRTGALVGTTGACLDKYRATDAARRFLPRT